MASQWWGRRSSVYLWLLHGGGEKDMSLEDEQRSIHTFNLGFKQGRIAALQELRREVCKFPGTEVAIFDVVQLLNSMTRKEEG